MGCQLSGVITMKMMVPVSVVTGGLTSLVTTLQGLSGQVTGVPDGG